MGEVIPQVMEGEIVNPFPLVIGITGFERLEPVRNPFLGKALATLRWKDIGPICISTRLEILVERLMSLGAKMAAPRRSSACSTNERKM